jgi:hypothetical protein
MHAKLAFASGLRAICDNPVEGGFFGMWVPEGRLLLLLLLLLLLYARPVVPPRPPRVRV